VVDGRIHAYDGGVDGVVGDVSIVWVWRMMTYFARKDNSPPRGARRGQRLYRRVVQRGRWLIVAEATCGAVDVRMNDEFRQLKAKAKGGSMTLRLYDARQTEGGPRVIRRTVDGWRDVDDEVRVLVELLKVEGGVK
jgi:hypothetical protein